MNIEVIDSLFEVYLLFKESTYQYEVIEYLLTSWGIFALERIRMSIRGYQLPVDLYWQLQIEEIKDIYWITHIYIERDIADNFMIQYKNVHIIDDFMM